MTEAERKEVLRILYDGEDASFAAVMTKTPLAEVCLLKEKVDKRNNLLHEIARALQLGGFVGIEGVKNDLKKLIEDVEAQARGGNTPRFFVLPDAVAKIGALRDVFEILDELQTI